MGNWDAAEEAIMNATCRVWQAFAIAWPSLSYASGHWVTINIDGREIPCQCDCTGLLIATITYMGYDASHWPVGSTGGFGSGLAEATSNFIYNLDGTLSDDWELIRDTSVTPKAGDMRGMNSQTSAHHSHADMFVGYDGTVCKGLNGGGTDGMHASAEVANGYLDTGVFDITRAALTIQDGSFTSILRYVKGSGQPATGSSLPVASDVRALKKLDIYLGLVNPGHIDFNIIDAVGEYRRVEPGYYPIDSLYISDEHPAQVTFLFSDLERVTVWMGFLAYYLSDTPHRFYLLFTTNGSDPRVSGRTVIQKLEDGKLVNDVDASVGFGAYVTMRLPFCIRAILADADDSSIIQAAATGYFTTQSDRVRETSEAETTELIETYYLDDLDATGKSPNAIDTHPQLYLNDSDDLSKAEPYRTIIPGLAGLE